MPKYLMLKHYRGGRTPLNDVPMTEWTPEEFRAHVAYMGDMEKRLGQVPGSGVARVPSSC